MTDVEIARLAKADQQAEALAIKLRHAMMMERKAGTRVKRAATLLRKWQAARRRIERKIGEDEVRRITNRLALSVPD